MIFFHQCEIIYKRLFAGFVGVVAKWELLGGWGWEDLIKIVIEWCWVFWLPRGWNSCNLGVFVGWCLVFWLPRGWKS